MKTSLRFLLCHVFFISFFFFNPAHCKKRQKKMLRPQTLPSRNASSKFSFGTGEKQTNKKKNRGRAVIITSSDMWWFFFSGIKDKNIPLTVLVPAVRLQRPACPRIYWWGGKTARFSRISSQLVYFWFNSCSMQNGNTCLGHKIKLHPDSLAALRRPLSADPLHLVQGRRSRNVLSC